MAYLAGLLHDMGKFTARFEDYILRAARGEPVRRGSVNHTFAGVRYVLSRYHGEACTSMRDVAAELIAYGIGAHHGLFDCFDRDGDSGFLHRMEQEDICYAEAVENFLSQCAGEKELDALFEKAVREVEACHSLILGYAKEEEGAFAYGFLSRLILSAVMEGDRGDTAAFLSGQRPPEFPGDRQKLWRDCLSRVEEKLARFSEDTPIARARREISRQCRDFGSGGTGIYRLEVPTGGGKTLASLRYALAAAEEHRKSRLFFVTPLLSVIEQNARVVREYIGDDSLILEHHSNLVRPEGEKGELDPMELLAETWNAPIILTTLVQLLHTLFLGKTSSVRRTHALVNSVIVFDEVQSVPRKMLSLFNGAINFLSEVCGATVVLCSATQPCLNKVFPPLRYGDPPELVELSEELRKAFCRTCVTDKRRREGYSPEELAELARRERERAGSLLVICNTKGEARTLYGLLEGEKNVFHLSTSMCPAHRGETMKAMTELLEKGEPVLCVSTQLVEAGIDFSFGCVVRLLAGMDNVAQAAGRCNRHGELGRLSPVYILNWRGENLSRLKEIADSQNASLELLEDFSRHSAQYGGDLLSKEAIGYYYSKLFGNLPQSITGFFLPEEHTTIYGLLSENKAFCSHSPLRKKNVYFLRQAFRTAGEKFQVFADNTVDLLVPFGKGKTVIEELGSERAQYDFGYQKKLLEEAKPYTVSVYDHQLAELRENGGLCRGNGVDAVLPQFYHEKLGVQPQGGMPEFMEV